MIYTAQQLTCTRASSLCPFITICWSRSCFATSWMNEVYKHKNRKGEKEPRKKRRGKRADGQQVRRNPPLLTTVRTPRTPPAISSIKHNTDTTTTNKTRRDTFNIEWIMHYHIPCLLDCKAKKIVEYSRKYSTEKKSRTLAEDPDTSIHVFEKSAHAVRMKVM